MTITKEEATKALRFAHLNSELHEKHYAYLGGGEREVALAALEKAGLIEELPEVEPFVAEWFEAHKNNLEYSVWEYIKRWNANANDQTDFFHFMDGKSLKPIETLFKMKQGYTVKKEPLFVLLYKKRLNDLMMDSREYPMKLYLDKYNNLTYTKDFAKKFTLSEINEMNMADYEVENAD